MVVCHQVFIQGLLDLTYGILGGAPVLFIPKFYYLPQIAEAYLSFVGWNSPKMNDFRLRGVVRSIFAPFLLNCPAVRFENVMKPFLQNFCPFSKLRLKVFRKFLDTKAECLLMNKITEYPI